MTLDDLFRRVVLAHLALIVICVALPVLAVVGMEARTPATYLGTVRLQVADSNPVSTTEADGMSSRVLALATSPGVIQQALDQTGLHRSATTMAATDVTAQRLGESSVVELTVRDQSRQAAASLSRKLGSIVAGFMNTASQPHFDEVLKQTDKDLAAARRERNALLARVATDAGNVNQRDAATIELASADATVGRLEVQRNSLVLADAARDQVVTVAPSRLDVVVAPSTLAARLVLGGLLGLVLGIAIAILLETLRPRAASVRAVARQLAAPVLGRAAEPATLLRDRFARAARRHRLATVVVVGVEKADEVAVTSLLQRLNHVPAVDVPLVAQVPTNGSGNGAVPAKPPVKPSGKGTRGGTQVATLAPPRKATRTSGPAPVVFCTLDQLDASEEDRAGVLVVCQKSPRQRDVDATHALVAGMRWPVLGVLELSRHHHQEPTS